MFGTSLVRIEGISFLLPIIVLGLLTPREAQLRYCVYPFSRLILGKLTQKKLISEFAEKRIGGCWSLTQTLKRENVTYRPPPRRQEDLGHQMSVV